MNQNYKESLSKEIYNNFSNLEEQIMFDIVRRIKQSGKITSTADWQINRLMILGHSSEDIERMLKEALDASYPQMFELYDKAIDLEYVRSKELYEQINEKYIPYDENFQLQQLTEALIRQTKDELGGITRSMGFYLDYGNDKRVFTPLAEVYQKYLDDAIYCIASGAFDYNAMLRKVVTQLTNSGLRTIDYASGYCSRAPVAARRAVMSGITQLTGKISDINAEKLGTDFYEVAWHSGARPTHATWQGMVYTKEQLVTVCGLGSVTGLEGANCYHERYPFIVGVSERLWSDEWLEEQNRKENTPKAFQGKEYTAYEAKQRQRQTETAMRAQREKVMLLKEGGADPDDILLARCKYQAQLDEYGRFSKKMGLTQERERIYLDMKGRIAPESRKDLKRYSPEMMKNASRDSKEHKKYQDILGKDAGSLADFRQMKYNDTKKYKQLKKQADTFSAINKKTWSQSFKEEAKRTFDRYNREGVVLSVHALSRIPRLNNPKFPIVSDEDLIKLLKSNPNYLEGEDKEIYFDLGKQLVGVRNKKTGEIISVIRRKNLKEGWEMNV